MQNHTFSCLSCPNFILWSAFSKERDQARVLPQELVQLAEGSGTLCRVIFDPTRRGMGVGKAFVDLLSKEGFEAQGFKRLLLNVFTFNVPAVRCYRSLGFRPLPRNPKPRAYEGQVWNLVVMEKRARAKAA